MITKGQQAIYQIHIDNYIEGDHFNDQGRKFEIVTDSYIAAIQLEKYDLENIENVLIIIKKSNFKYIQKNWFKLLAKVRQKIKFKFIQKDKSEVGYLSCYQIYQFHKKIKSIDQRVLDDQFESDVDLLSLEWPLIWI